MSSKTKYWDETLAASFESQEAYHLFKQLTIDQRNNIADDLECARENYGLAFYEPPASERLSNIEDEYKRKLKDLQEEFNNYKNNAESAVKIALRQRPDTHVAIGPHGEVTRFAGRTDRIQ